MSKKILIADDDPDIVELLSIRLQAHGYEVVTAENGVWALVKANEEKPDLIILDIKMPSGGGVSVYENLKNSRATAFTPVIFITAFPSDTVRKRVMNIGAHDFVSKPFDDGELLLKIKRALGEIE